MRMMFMDLKLFKILLKDYMSEPYGNKDGKLIDFIDWLEFTKLKSWENTWEYDKIFIGEVYKN
jgi:hypothetical protein